MTSQVDHSCVHALRFLSCDAIEQARSGHPGLPLGAAPMAYVLWTRHLRHHPAAPDWADRDRFVLSAGHGSALLYSLLVLSGYGLTLDELRAFRQWGSRAAGHPESPLCPGVEVTTGPLGQGLANAVGMAIAERHLAARYNTGSHTVVDHYTYALVGDGCLMEGVSYEAAALAGHLGLGKLIVLFDSNRISLAGSTSLTTSEDTGARFAAAGWQVLKVDDGEELQAIDDAITVAKQQTDKPTLIEVSTVIGHGAPTKQGSFKAHGSPLGAEELDAAKKAAGWPVEPRFFVPDDVRQLFASVGEKGKKLHEEWLERFSLYEAELPALAGDFRRRMQGKLPQGWDKALPKFEPDAKGLATRKASETIMQAAGAVLPELFGGSADLDPSTFTWLKEKGDFQRPGAVPGDLQGAVGGPWGYEGRNLHYGVREHAMGSIANGLAAHGGLIPYTATFLVFSDYMRPAIRLAALSRYPVVFIFTHDSVGVGEDGPTHQPIEQIATLRAIPNLTVIRPADANEVAVSWQIAIEQRNAPTVLVFSRQALPTIDRTQCGAANGTRRGAYVLWDSAPAPEILLMASGSEVAVILDAAQTLANEGHRVRVVSMPSWELFEHQPESYRREVLPERIGLRIAVEAGIRMGWERYTGVGPKQRMLSIDRFGASAPGPEVMKQLGISPEAVVTAAHSLLMQEASS
ncbi:transketolase [Candidatus Bipolaricaulota bacterium]|nr:transketolase [Candidatus Bipolaricaulota bacterium]